MGEPWGWFSAPGLLCLSQAIQATLKLTSDDHEVQMSLEENIIGADEVVRAVPVAANKFLSSYFLPLWILNPNPPRTDNLPSAATGHH